MSYRILVACRLKSSRLPLKALCSIDGRPLIIYLLQSLLRVHSKEHIIVCTSSLSTDDELADLVSSFGYTCFRGDPVDVAQRFIDCVYPNPPEYIVRVTGDNPFTCPFLITDLLTIADNSTKDYVYSASLPIGFRSEIIRTSALKSLHSKWSHPELSEYMTFFLKRPDMVNLLEHRYVDYRHSLRDLVFTVDTIVDLKRAQLLASYWSNSYPDLKNINLFYKAYRVFPFSPDSFMQLPSPTSFSYIN